MEVDIPGSVPPANPPIGMANKLSYVELFAESKIGKTIRLRAPTLDRLNKLRHKGQSYDGLVNELLDLHENNATKDDGIQSPQQKKNEGNEI